MSEHKILLVDNDPVAVEAISQALKGNGYRITATGDGKEAMDLIAQDKFDLVLSELVVGTFDGLEILNKVKALHPENGAIIMTAHPEKIDSNELLELNIDAFLFKPCDPEKILTCVSHCIEHLEIIRSGADRRKSSNSPQSESNTEKRDRRKFYF